MINEPVVLYGRTVPNRVVFHPMEGCDGTPEGGIDELTRRRYLRFAQSGAGIIWFEATAVSGECRANPRQLYINEKTVPGFKALLKEVRAAAIAEFGFSPLIIAQLTHSGRFSKPHGTPEPIVAYRNALWEKGRENQPYTVADDEYLRGIPGKYRAAARLAAEAGFDGVDVKCCHGYLFDELLSAFEREGEYGGSFENRTRLYFECVDAVREALPDGMFVTTRLNACDCFPYPYGYGVNKENEIDLTEAKLILSTLSKRGIELVNLTLGNPYLIPHINRPCIGAPEKGELGCERIKRVTAELQREFPETKLVMSGLSFLGENAVSYADRMITEGVCSLAGFGRMTFAYPTFYADYLRTGALSKNKCCLKCGKCTELMRAGTVAGCPMRDGEVYMPYYKKYVTEGK